MPNPLNPNRKRGPYTVHDTLQRAKVQGAIEYLRAKEIPKNDTEVFKFFKFKPRTSYDLIQPEVPARTYYNRDDINETRGYKPKLLRANIVATDSLLEETNLGLKAKEIA